MQPSVHLHSPNGEHEFMLSIDDDGVVHADTLRPDGEWVSLLTLPSAIDGEKEGQEPRKEAQDG